MDKLNYKVEIDIIRDLNRFTVHWLVWEINSQFKEHEERAQYFSYRVI
jgi:hypothetical protein